MPELPEVETICRDLSQKIVGLALHEFWRSSFKLRRPLPDLSGIKNQNILHVQRRAKYGIIHWSSGHDLIFHLGMSGRMLIYQNPYTPQKHDHAVWNLGGISLVFHDPRRFGFIDLVQGNTPSYWQKLGPEPLEAAFNASYLQQALKNKRQTIKVALLDQELVTGIGNIYASEALWHAGISPFNPAYLLDFKQCQNLVYSIQEVLKLALSRGGSSLKDYRHIDGKKGDFQHMFCVYDRLGKDCPKSNCSGKIIRQTQGGRSTFFCSHCQKIPN